MHDWAGVQNQLAYDLPLTLEEKHALIATPLEVAKQGGEHEEDVEGFGLHGAI